MSDTFYTYWGYVTKDKTLICVYDSESTGYSNRLFYCREDKYDTLLEKLDDEFSEEKYAYSYSYYDLDSSEYINGVYTLTEEQTETVDKVISTVEPHIDLYNPETYVEVYGCSDDMLFCKLSYIISYSNGVYDIILETASDTMVFNVPSEYNLTFSEIMAEQFVSDGIYTEFEEDII